MTAWIDPKAVVATAVQLELPLPITTVIPAPEIRNIRRLCGKTAYLSGLAAEESVVRFYNARGMDLMAKRWRGSCAEIDLILRDGAVVVFVEVKKSRSFDAALLSLGRAQRRRITLAALEYLGCTGLGQLTDIRFDLAMVNDIGAVEILENAFGEDE